MIKPLTSQRELASENTLRWLEFSTLRIAQLLNFHKISARSLNLRIGRNGGYLQHMLNGYQRISLDTLFDICDELGLTPAEFFDPGIQNPGLYHQVVNALSGLNDKDLAQILDIVLRLRETAKS